MMYAISPFERVLGEAGGSLALAVANGEVKWPAYTAHASGLSEQLRKLILKCLTVERAQRPDIQLIVREAETIEQSLQQR